MTVVALEDWLERLGYVEPAVLHRRGEDVPEGHSYAPEIKALLHPEGAIRARAVFDVEGLPTVVFLGGSGDRPLGAEELDLIRKRIWNQNLASIILEVRGEVAQVVPARKLRNAAKRVELADARPDGPFSALDVSTANLTRRLPNWFDVKARVDRKLLDNLSVVVARISRNGFTETLPEEYRRPHAELLMGQVLFISYLEHRDIVSDTFRDRCNVEKLHSLVAGRNSEGLRHLIDILCEKFNGDFLSDDRHDPWSALNDTGFEILDRFLRRTDMRTGQGDFWNYDFSFIPVELLSGLYECFLSPDEQARSGSYYTPRHLAMLAVDQAFAASLDPLSETILDGACGSGILLTTAYRRLIAIREARENSRLSFKERRDLLVSRIFGADVNLMACRVSAFSLYLSLLEGLNPSDILEAQERENTKLPTLANRNLLYGDRADFFRPDHGFSEKRFSLIISNPPWVQPSGTARTSADRWAKKAGAPLVQRQIAGAFAIRALDFLQQEGRICLILPIALLLGSSSGPFVSYFFRALRPTRLINFGDLKDLLFPTTEHTCHVLLGSRRSSQNLAQIPFDETFDYCVPKANISLNYGLLTMQSADRHQPQTISVIQQPQLLVSLMWGDANDLSIWTRLATFGALSDFWKARPKGHRWICRKGIHVKDRSRPPVSAARLQGEPFVTTAALGVGSPVLHSTRLSIWPAEQRTVAHLNDEILRVFDGPRVLFPDGFSKEEHNLRSVFYDGPAAFKHSIGVIAGPQEDAALLQFVAIYLRSKLSRYFMMLRVWKMLCAREAIHLKDIESFPFFEPNSAPNPKSAAAALARVSKRMSEISELPDLEQSRHYETLRDEFDDDVFDYFDLSGEERELVSETVELLMPSILPRSYASLNTLLQRPAGINDVRYYGRALAHALTSWREKTNGKGRFEVRIVANAPHRVGSVGIVRIEYNDKRTMPARTSTRTNDNAVLATLDGLRKLGLTVVPSGNAIRLVPDTFFWTPQALYLVRPLIRHSWTVRQAMRDAERIVRDVHVRQHSNLRPEVA